MIFFFCARIDDSFRTFTGIKPESVKPTCLWIRLSAGFFGIKAPRIYSGPAFPGSVSA